MKHVSGDMAPATPRDACAQYDSGLCGMIRKLCDGIGLQGLGRLFSERWPYRHKIDINPFRLQELVEQCGAKPFHVRAINKRIWRRHVCIACGWIADHCPRGVSIFEPGCGAGSNLLWLASRGFQTISGADIDSTALNLCRALQKEMGLSFPVFQDDGMQPKYPTQPQDVILSVNWLYHIPHASLGIFFEKYLPYLKHDGVVICDIIDSAYNNEIDNNCHSEDVAKPQHERRPTEYTFRMSQLEVSETAAQYGLHILRHARIYAIPQRRVYMLSR